MYWCHCVRLHLYLLVSPEFFEIEKNSSEIDDEKITFDFVFEATRRVLIHLTTIENIYTKVISDCCFNSIFSDYSDLYFVCENQFLFPSGKNLFRVKLLFHLFYVRDSIEFAI